MRCRGHLTVLGPDDRLPEPPRSKDQILAGMIEHMAGVERLASEWRQWLTEQQERTG